MNIKYLGHNFILVFSKDDYSEFICEICNLSAAMKHVSYDWYHNLWDKLNLSCDEYIIKKILE